LKSLLDGVPSITASAIEHDNKTTKSDKPCEIAQSLKRSAERSDRLKSSPFRSAMSMLTFYTKSH